MLRPVPLRQLAVGPASATAAAVRRLAEAVGPKVPAIGKAAEEAARVTGAGK